MTIAPLQQVAVPTARAINWTPLLSVSGLLLLVLLVARSADRPVDIVLALASAALASVVVAALHDPAAALLAAVPVSTMQRRVLRLTIVLLPVLAVWWVSTAISDSAPGSGSPVPLLALAAAGVSLAVWVPPHLGVLAGAFVPVAWYALDTTVPGAGVVSDVAGWWHTAPEAVLGVALLVLVAGRRR